MRTRNLILSVCAAGALFLAGTLVGANRFTKPSTILHVVTIKWKPEATEAQKTAVLQGVEKMAGEVAGVKSVWTKGIKVQGEGYTAAFVMEFENAKAFADYVDNPAHKEWDKMYQAVHERSTTHDITN